MSLDFKDLDQLEQNTHLVLHYLYRIHPANASVTKIAKATGLHKNTVYKLTRNLDEDLNYIGNKPVGRSPRYFCLDGMKEKIDKWLKTPIGEKNSNDFNEILEKQTKETH